MSRAVIVSIMAVWWCAGVALAAGSPSVTGASRPETDTRRGTIPRSSAPIDDAYRVGPKDILAIEIWTRTDVEHKRREYVVEKGGTVYLPLLNDVKVGGLSVPEITEKLSRLYADFIIKPQVFVLITEYNARTVTVIGEVVEDTRLVLKGRMRLMEALTEAGGETESASDLCRVVRRGEGDDQVIFDVSLSAINAGAADQNVLLQDGDTLIVMTNKDVVFVTGFVMQPGQYDFTDGLTAQQAVILAGGIAEGGAAGRAKVFRPEVGGTVKKYKINVKKFEESFVLRPGDMINVPASWL